MSELRHSPPQGEPGRLGPGAFYGRVAERRRCAHLLLSEIVHCGARSFPRHAHERAYLCLLLGGSYSEEVGRHPLTHPPMGLSLRPAGLEHRDRVGPRGGRFFTIELDGDWLGAAIDSRPAPGGPVLIDGADALGRVLRLYREFRRWDPCSAPVAESLAVEVLARLSRPAVCERRPPGWLGRAAERVRECFRENVPLAELASDAGVHPVHLSRTFRRFLGRSPGELAREVRVERVCRGLADPERSLAELALDAGFADQSHMTRVFKRQMGIPPGALRNTLSIERKGSRATLASLPLRMARVRVEAPA